MERAPETRKRGLAWGFPASASVHAVVLALLIFGLPQLRHQPDESSAIEVEIVPEEEAPQEKPEEKAAETEEQKDVEEAKKEEEQETPQRPVSEFAEKDEGPKQEAQEAEQEQAKAQQRAPPPPPGQQAQKPEEKPAPPESPQQAKTEEKPASPAPAAAEQTEKAEQDSPPPAASQSREPSEQAENSEPLRTLRPVFRFGEEDEGPRIAEDGNAAEEARTEPAEPTEELALNPDAEKTEAAASLVPAPAPDEAATEEKKLHSRKDTGGKVAKTAIDGMPRGVRAGELCASELREQLRRAIPPFWPDLLPAYRLDKGTVLQVRRGAFRSAGQWFDLKFRCEIDADATMILSFDHEVGAPVPRHEWAARGFPAR